MIDSVSLEIELENPYPGVDIGLQKGSGSNYETIQIQQATTGNLLFHFDIKVKGNPEKDPHPDFAGPFVQGPKGIRFIYLDIGACAGQLGSSWSRRLKIPLNGITWDMLSAANHSEKGAMFTMVPGRAKDGGPSCATVKPFGGWKVAE